MSIETVQDSIARSSAAITVITPTYNEAENIQDAINRCQASLNDLDYEILVVDDDSPDGTWQIAGDVADQDPRVGVLLRNNARGLASAVEDGIQEANGTIVAVIDADLQHPPERLPDFVAAIEDGADIAIGSRRVDGGGVDGWSWPRRAISCVATAIAKVAVPSARGISDPVSGFFAVRRSTIENVDLDARGYKILLEVLSKAEYDTVQEVPYTFRDRLRGESKLGAREYVAFLEHIAALGWRERGLDRYLAPYRAVQAAEFAFIGGLGVFVNMAFFAAVVLGGGHYLAAGVVAFLMAVNFNFLGNWVLTFDQPDGRLRDMYVKFLGVSVAGFAIYTAILAGVIEIAAVGELAANVVAIAGSSVWNYLGSEQVAFEADA